MIHDTKLTEGKEVLAIDPRYFRPTEVELLIGDPTKAKTKLKWEPEYDLKALVKDMIERISSSCIKKYISKKAAFRP